MTMYTYNIDGVNHTTSKELNKSELETVVGKYRNAGVLDPKAREQEEQSYAMNVANQGLLAATRNIYNRENEIAFEGSNEELADQYYEKMRHIEGNFGTLGMLVGNLSGDYYSEEEKADIATMWHNWETTVPFYSDKDQFWKGIGDYGEAMGTDLIGTYLPLAASVASLGFGTPAAIGTRVAGQAAAKSALKYQVAKYLGKHFTEGFKQGVPWALSHSLATQIAKTDLDMIDGVSLKQTALDTTIGSVVNGSLATTFGGIKLTANQLGGAVAKPVVNPVTKETAKATPLTPEGADQTLKAAGEFMDGMADPSIKNKERAEKRETFLESISLATLENIEKNSASGQKISQPEARAAALERLSTLGLKEWTPEEILGKLRDLPETHGNFSSFAALAVDVETSMYNNFVKAYREGTDPMKAFGLYNDSVAIASRYSGEAARALAYQKARSRLNPDELANVLDEMVNNNNATEAAAAFEALAKAKWGSQRTAAQRALGSAETAADVVSELRTYNLLSAVSTMSINTFSGYMHMNQKWVQKSLGGLMGLDGRELSEGLAQGINVHRNIMQTIPFMARGFNSSNGYIDRTRSSVELGDRGNSVAVGNRDFQIFGDTKSIGGAPSDIAKQPDESLGMYGANILGNIWRALGKRGIAGTDEWIKHAQFRTELQNQVVRNLQKKEGLGFIEAYAKSESIVNTLTKEQLEHSINGSVSRNPMVMNALIDAREVAFQNGFRKDIAGAIGQGFNNIAQTGKMGKFQVPAFLSKLIGNAIAPFVRTPSNIFSHLGEMTPVLQMFSQTMRETMAAGGPRAREMENKILFGSVVWASAASFAALNMVSNSGSGSRGQRNVDSAIDGTGYAIVLDDGTRYNIRKGDPYAKPFLIMARMKDVFEYGDEQKQTELMTSLVIATAKSMAETPTLTGMSQIADLLDERSAGNALKKFGTNYATSFLPYVRLIKEVLVDSGNDVLIPEVLDLYDVLQQPHAFNINGRPDNVKRDAIFGTPIKRNSYAFTPMSGIEVTKTSKDPILLELKRLHMGVEAPPPVLNKVDMTKYKVDTNSNQNVYDLYQELVGTVVNKETGQNLYEALETLFTDKEYLSNFNDDLLTYGMRSQGRKVKAVKEELSSYRRVYAVDALKMRLGLDHPFIIELSRVDGINTAVGAGASKETVEKLFNLNK